MQELRLSDLRESWNRHLTASNKVWGTRRAYLAALDALIDHSGDAPLSEVTRGSLEAFIADELERTAPATVSIKYRALQQFFKWADLDGELENGSPMARMKPPIVPVQPPPVITQAEVTRLLDACRGNAFADRRDLAVIRLFSSTGIRLSELTNMKVDETWVNDRRAKVMGKGRRERLIRFDLEAANAIERYMRIRRRHKLAALPELWLGHQGPLTPNGMYQALKRRARKAGVEMHPHLFRHTFAHEWMSRGGNESDLQNLAGWKSAQMIRRYGASAATERALSAYDRVMLRARRS